MNFIIISPGYNASQWANFNIGSVVGQTINNYTQIIVDDGSLTDINKCYYDIKKMVVLKTEKKRGALASHIDAMDVASSFANDDDVIIHLDLDDWFLHPFVLERVIKEYEKGAWATYGNYVDISGYPSICRNYFKKFNRKSDTFSWIFSHLRTFKYGVYKKISKHSFIDEDTNLPFQMAGDVAIFSSILELCPVEKVKFIQDPLIMYNTISSLNENKVSLKKQQECVVKIMNKPSYKEI